MSKNVEKLSKRLREEHRIIVDVNSFRRTYAGYWQRRAGAWVWEMKTEEPYLFTIGSIYPVSMCVNGKYQLDIAKINFRDIDITVEELGDVESAKVLR